MSLAVTGDSYTPSSSRLRRKAKAKPSSRDQHHLRTLLLDAHSTYADSQLANNVEKQLSFLANLQKSSKTPIEVYAQDPTFTRQDEVLLSSLDIRISRTPSGSSLGEATSIMSSSTLVYSPFLTLEAYEQLFIQSKQPVPYLIGDDFNALLEKWPKYTPERAQVEKVTKSALGRYRRKAISGSGFWVDSDGAFPMAVYAVQSGVKEKAKI
ncbi:hypothetical protein N0V90_009964 [Kalmusia sp. IMI 367209]|nr:hypothetical protein N0V90_009964 [Kalmusia sp. IMI 367209]